jgi:hypothetical protein
MEDQLFSTFGVITIIGIGIMIAIFVAYLFGRDPFGIQPALDLQRFGFAVDPRHPFADRLNTALESAFAIDEEVNE